MMFSSLETSLGKLYGLDTCPGFAKGKVMNAIRGMESDVGAFSFSDTYDSFITNPGELYFCKHSVLLFKYLHENCIKRGINTIIMNPQLEENYKVQSLFGDYKTTPFMRRRAYKRAVVL